MKKTFLSVITLATVLLLGACGGGVENDPNAVTEAFWNAVRSGGLKSAKEYVTKEGQALINTGMTMGFQGEFNLAPAVIEGDWASVLIVDAHQPDEQQFYTVLVQEDGQWKLHRDIFNSSLPAQ